MPQYPLKVKQVSGGQRNVTYQIRGFVSGQNLVQTAIKMDRGLKMSSALWIVQEKMVLNLSWNEEELLFPMESRNAARFDQNIQPPDGWNGTMYLSSQGWDSPNPIGKSFLIVLDFDR